MLRNDSSELTESNFIGSKVDSKSKPLIVKTNFKLLKFS